MATTFLSKTNVNSTENMTCHFINNDVLLGGYDMIKILQNYLRFRSINISNCPGISKFPTNIMKVIYSDIK